MLSLDILSGFILASSLLALAPGPDNLFVLTQAALFGPRAGLMITLGLCTGLIVHTMAVAMGVAIVFQTSALAFSLLQGLGAAYLLYLAWEAWRAASTRLDLNTQTEMKIGTLYRRGIIMNLTNPKVSIFFLAFLPQFIDPAQGNMIEQTMMLGLTFILVALLVFGSIAVLAGHLGQRLQQSPKAQRWLNRIAAVVLGVLAVKLATSTISM